MSKRGLAVRSAPFLVTAYVVSPVSAMTVLWLIESLSYLSPEHYPVGTALDALALIIVGGGMAGLIAELILVTPILVAIHLRKWDWPNIWVAGLVGVVIGEMVGQAFGMLIGIYHRATGWGAVAQPALIFGFLGLATAIVFHLIAFRRIEREPAPGTLAAEKVAL